MHGHRYGLIGENGVGKSTLLRRIAKQSLPGIPLHFRIGYVQQELPMVENMTVLDYILKANESAGSLEELVESLRLQEKELEDQMDVSPSPPRCPPSPSPLTDPSPSDGTEHHGQRGAGSPGRGALRGLGEGRRRRGEARRQETAGRLGRTHRRRPARDTHPRSRGDSGKRRTPSTPSPPLANPLLLSLFLSPSQGPKIVNVLDGLGLSKPLKRLSVQLSELSGGWRMRAALAQALCHLDSIDVLLLDEPTNHCEYHLTLTVNSNPHNPDPNPTLTLVDLPTVAWLQDFLKESPVIVLFVSHDRAFLDAVATDIIEMKNLGLHYFHGGYEDFLLHTEEMAARKANLQDARVRKETHIQKTIDAAHARGDDKQAKAKQKKLERAAMTRAIDGHRFKNFSLAKMDEKSMHLAEVVDLAPEKDFRYAKFKFPPVDVPSLRLASDSSPLLSLEKCAISYQQKAKNVLEGVTLALTLKSRVGIIGRNGKGKTTLLHALAYGDALGVVRVPQHTHLAAPGAAPAPAQSQAESNQLVIKRGQVWKHHNLKIGVVSQHQIDLLSSHLFETPVSYVQSLLSANPVLQQYYKTELDIRAHLGAFGLSGPLALQQIGSLSGGQKARLSFAIVCLQRPHLLFLDEPSNHLSMDSIDSLIAACQDFAGGIVLISHNRYLIGKICDELWLVDNGAVSVRRPAPSTGKESGADKDSDGEGSDQERSAFEDLLEECVQQILRSS